MVVTSNEELSEINNAYSSVIELSAHSSSLELSQMKTGKIIVAED